MNGDEMMNFVETAALLLEVDVTVWSLRPAWFFLLVGDCFSSVCPCSSFVIFEVHFIKPVRFCISFFWYSFDLKIIFTYYRKVSPYILRYFSFPFFYIILQAYQYMLNVLCDDSIYYLLYSHVHVIAFFHFVSCEFS